MRHRDTMDFEWSNPIESKSLSQQDKAVEP